MRQLAIATSLTAVLFPLGCEDEPATAPAAARPQFEISDARHGTGTPGFYFLPPMVAAPTFTGTFVGSLALEVEICVWNGTACGAPIATFTTETGPGSETVRVDPEAEQYTVKWRTGQFGLDSAKTYRIRALFGSTELGHADVDVIATARERRSVNTAEFVPVVNGQTLPITFRIEDGTILALAVGAMQTWYNTSQGGASVTDAYAGLTLSVMAKSHVAAWNNFNIRFYTGCTDFAFPGYPAGSCGGSSEGAPYPRTEWQNDPASAQRAQIEWFWYGYYGALSTANDLLRAIEPNGVVITNPSTTNMVETMVPLVQALSLSDIALNYDKGFIVDENSDANSALTFFPRRQIRDAALAKFNAVITRATANPFTVPGSFFGGPGITYDNVKIAQIANTMAARLLAYFPRDAAENADVSAGGQVDWAKVASYASKGISSPTGGAPFDWVFHQDGCIAWCDFFKTWTNDMTTMRIHTRVAHLMDPATQPDPWNLAANSPPNSADHRLGDGTLRPERGGAAFADFIGVNPDLTGNGGYDYAWSFRQEIQRRTRGLWHQSAIGQVRYDSLATCGDNPQGSAAGVGDAPIVLAAENDLIWAEALMRQAAPDLATAATLVNYTRVGPDRLGRPRGGLPPSTGTLADLQYEQDVELPGSNIAPFFNQRRIDNLEPLTPHEMPVPAKQLNALQLPLYTWGGANNPPNSSPTASASAVAAIVQNAPRVWVELHRQARAELNAILSRRR